MKRRINRATGSSIGWLLVGVATLPFVAASVESKEDSHADRHLEQLMAKHDVRSVIYGVSASAPDCDAHDAQERAR